MKVKELIKVLRNYDPEKVVVLSKDEEGNRFSPLDENFEDGYYRPESSYYGEAYYGYHNKEEYEENCEIDIDDKDIQKAIILFPLN